VDLKNLVDKMKANLKSLIHSNSIHNIFNNEINNKFSKIGYKNKIIAINIITNNNDSLLNNNNTNNRNI